MKHRAILHLTAMAAALVLSSGVALAVTKHCKSEVPCRGTNERDRLLGTDGRNQMFGKGRGDTLKGFGASAALNGGTVINPDTDTVYFDAGDTINANCEIQNP
jgi:hypothetical protein